MGNSKKQLTNLHGLAIIVILLILTLTSPILFDNLAAKKRDQQRLMDMVDLQDKLKGYFIYNNSFPLSPEPIEINLKDFVSLELKKNGIEKKFIDPSYPKYSYTYQSDAGGKSYTITFCLETKSQKGYNKGCDNKIGF